ncbi:hypothetical protein [Pseudoxanthomonas suwonensis]|uniref:Secreted protein n=1 Tax=Pseudoxanthomonas suwonensis TaxID=314722 RepID=A0A0E3UQ26_9GAMM|nr:hypothetical protein [Pseudoxanthomonas suwonensis]AKC88350.1 hypothetical protein WQ53_10740 [Pseudoxanthomonas suwonensis]
MRRLLPFLLLLAAPAMCWATASESDPAPKRGACVYARPAPALVADGDAPQARPATPPAARSTPRTSATGGGGSDGDAVAPRTRGNRWHSFLPGMFR